MTGNCADLTSSNPGYRLHGPRESSQRRAPDARQGTSSPACCTPAGMSGYTTGQPNAQPILIKFLSGSAPQPARVSSGPWTWSATLKVTASRTSAQGSRLGSPCTLEETWSAILTSLDHHHRLMLDLTRRSPPSHGCRSSRPANSNPASYEVFLIPLNCCITSCRTER